MFSLAFGSYLFGTAASKCIKGSLFSISQSISAKTNRKLILDRLDEFIAFDSFVKQLSSIIQTLIETTTELIIALILNFSAYFSFISLITKFSDIFQHIFTILFMWSLITITISGAMLMIQIQLV